MVLSVMGWFALFCYCNLC